MDKGKNQVNDSEHKEAKNNQDNKKKKNPPPKPRIISGASGTTSKAANIRIVEVPKGGEKEQEFGNYLKKMMKENLPNLVKEIDMQVQEAQRVPIMFAKRPTPRHIIIKRAMVRDKERLLKAAREEKLPDGCQTGGGRGEWVKR